MRMKEEFLKMLEGLNEKTERKIKKLEDFIFFLGTFQNYFSNKKLIKKNSDIAYILEKEFDKDNVYKQIEILDNILKELENKD